jgi:hypothetical protein
MLPRLVSCGAALLLGSMAGSGSAFGASPPPAPAAPAPAAAAVPLTVGEAVATPDLERRLGQWKRVEMPFAGGALTARERQMVGKLVEACRALESIYWRQGDPQGLELVKRLAGAKAGSREDDVRRLLWINGSRYDLLDDNRPFIGSQPPLPGRELYPAGLTRQEIESYVAAHPEAKAAIYDEHAIVLRQGAKLTAVPYHVAYRQFLVPAAAALREAAALADEPAFAKFLRLRADALLTDDYLESDLAWLDLVNPKFDVIFAPYETYLDDLLGVKTSYGAAVLIRNETESAKLAVFQKYVPDIQDALPLPPEDRPSKHGHVAPMEVMDAPFRAGDLRHGYQAVADNLPNDPRVQERKGAKHIFFKNFMDARVDDVILPVAKLVMQPDQAAKASADGYLAAVMMHEICHGLGPAFAHRDGRQIDIREAIGPIYSSLEEAKADVTGMFGLSWLVAHGALPKERLEEYYSSYVAGIFRTVRFGAGEAHSKAEMMELNFLLEKGSVRRDPATNRYVIEYARIPGALAALAMELLQTEAAGDRARAEAWFAKYGTMPADLAAALRAAAGVPVDLDPHGSFSEDVE